MEIGYARPVLRKFSAFPTPVRVSDEQKDLTDIFTDSSFRSKAPFDKDKTLNLIGDRKQNGILGILFLTFKRFVVQFFCLGSYLIDARTNSAVGLTFQIQIVSGVKYQG